MAAATPGIIGPSRQADDRTDLVRDEVPYRSANLDETPSLMDRHLGYALAQMNGLWWFTLAGDDTFRDEAIMARVAAISEAARSALDDRGARRRDVAVLADEQVYAWMKTGPKALMYPLVTEMRRLLIHSGVTHGSYLLPDIAHPDMPDYRMYIFLNAFRVPQAMRAAIAAEVRHNGAMAVWFYAPGSWTPRAVSTSPPWRS